MDKPGRDSLPLKTVDVFTARPYFGNPVAVVLEADGLDTGQMQRIARWTNLSETTFVLAPRAAGADYRARIFTPVAELPFAGHPTLGTAHALLESGRVAPRPTARGGELVQECDAGSIRIEVSTDAVEGRWLSFELPRPAIRELDAEERRALAEILGAPLAGPPCLIDVGPRWVVVPLASAAAVLACQADLARLAALDAATDRTGVVIFGLHPPGHPARLEVRAFAPAHGVPEDPVCGSGNGCVAAWLRHMAQDGRAPSDLRQTLAPLASAPSSGKAGTLLATQGAAVGRRGVIRLDIGAEVIRVGGQCVTCVDGVLTDPHLR